MLIKNKNDLATSGSRRAALEIVEAGIERVLPSSIMQSAVSYNKLRRIIRVCGEEFPVSNGRIFVIGGGKASCLMADSLGSIIGYDTITDGIVICKDKPLQNPKIQILQAGHPIPDQRGVEDVERILRLKEQYKIAKDDLIVCLISGGGSALMPCPAEGLSLDDKKKLTALLLACGAEIHEINAVRKHLSKIKGGRLGQYFAPAKVISLILSDVIGNDLSTIASGPTVPDLSTYADAYRVLEKYDLLARVPIAAVDILRKGCKGCLDETPKVLDNCSNYIIGDSNLALQAMAQRATEMGYRPKIVTAELKGDTTATAFSTASEIIKAGSSFYNAFILGGETTLQLPENPGTGGRNQHYVAASLLAMENYPHSWTMASVGTDGSDYLPDVAGAIIDNNSPGQLSKNNVKVRAYLERCDSNTLLKKLGDSLIVTGETGTNVGDVIIYLIE
jgi:glycerate 2-kinase